MSQTSETLNMSVRSSIASAAPAGFNLDPSILEESMKKPLNCASVIVFSSLGDVFRLVPINGFTGTDSIQEQTGIEIETKQMTPVIRLQVFSMVFEEGGLPNETRLFARVEDGKCHEMAN